MGFRSAAPIVLLGCAVSVASCGDEVAPPPTVSYIEVTPGDTTLAPGDSAVFRGQPVDVEDRLLDLPLTFEVEDPSIGTVEVRDSTVSRTAVFRAMQQGDTRIVVEEEGGVAAFVPVRVRRVTDFSPAFTAFGGTVGLRGRGFGPDSRVFFGAAQGVTRSVSEDGTELRTWVPWDAENAPLRIVMADGTDARTEEPFVLTGGDDDALEPNSFSLPTGVELPFRNPFLRTRVVSSDSYSFDLTANTPVTIRVEDAEEFNTWNFRSVLQLNRVDELGEFYGVAPVYSFGRDQRQDGVVTHPMLPAGSYVARVYVAPGFGVVDRRYSIQIETSADYTVEPDGLEPNELPVEAPLIQIPVMDTLALENPWTQDYYRIQVEERSRVTLLVGTFGRSKGVFFYQDEDLRSVQWHLTDPGPSPETWTGGITSLSPIELACTVEAGEYIIGVLENEGVEGPYTLSVDAEPTESDFFNCRQPGFGESPVEGELRAAALAVPR